MKTKILFLFLLLVIGAEISYAQTNFEQTKIDLQTLMQVIEFSLAVVYATLLIAQSLRTNNLVFSPILFISGIVLPVITYQYPLLGGGNIAYLTPPLQERDKIPYPKDKENPLESSKNASFSSGIS